jgi:hypothetical protein
LPGLFLFRRAQVRLDAGFQVSAGCAVSVRPGWSCPPGKAGGWVDPDAVRTALRPDTWLVSIMQVNNETGVCQPLAAIADGVESHPAWFHTDAAQGFGKDFDPLRHRRLDMISHSGHKNLRPQGHRRPDRAPAWLPQLPLRPCATSRQLRAEPGSANRVDGGGAIRPAGTAGDRA